MYRPTVRYADVYKTYVDNLFQATTLDRNQIIRLALFSAAHSREFQHTIQSYLKKDVHLPSPLWQADQAELWMDRNSKQQEESEDVNAHVTRKENVARSATGTENTGRQPATEERVLETARRTRPIPITKRTENGGISIRIG